MGDGRSEGFGVAGKWVHQDQSQVKEGFSGEVTQQKEGKDKAGERACQGLELLSAEVVAGRG